MAAYDFHPEVRADLDERGKRYLEHVQNLVLPVSSPCIFNKLHG